MGKHNISTIAGRTRRVRGAITLAAIAAATVGGAVIGTASSEAATTTATPNAATRAHIPWSRVGSGWMLASLAHGTANTLYLVDTAGHRYADASLPKGDTVGEWSGDGQRATVYRDGEFAGEVDLHTGKIHRISIAAPKGGDVEVIGYTKPQGHALLVDVGRPHGTGSNEFIEEQLERYGLDGKHQQTYPRIVKGAGTIAPEYTVETPDGAELVVHTTHGMALLRNNGTVVRRLVPTQTCYPVRTLNASTVLATCNGTLRSVPLSGAKSRAVTAGVNKGAPFGLATDWSYSHGTLGLAYAGCGPATLVKVGADGRSTPVPVPSPSGSHGRAVFSGHSGALVEGVYNNHGECQQSTSTLFVYNAVTKHSKALLGPGATTGTVTGSAVYPADRV